LIFSRSFKHELEVEAAAVRQEDPGIIKNIRNTAK
jgi:hypothetical protein